MSKLLLFTTLAIFATISSCSDSKTKSTSVFEGHLMNNSEKFVVLFQDERPVDTAYLDTNNNFKFRIENPTGNLYNYSIGNEYQYVYLTAGDSLVMYANLLNVQETISYSGSGGGINNFMVRQNYENADIQNSIRNFHSLPTEIFKAKMDSVRLLKQSEVNEFIATNPALCNNAKKIAAVSALAFLDKEMETYPFIYQRKNNDRIINNLPDKFYEHRKGIDYNNELLEHYRPYYSYMVMFVNNLAFLQLEKQKLNNYSDINKVSEFHFNKIKIIDSIFPKGNLRDNLYRNAAYAYLFNIQNEKDNNKYIQLFEQYNKGSKHKAELGKVFKSTLALQKGYSPPDFDLVDSEGNIIKLSDTFKPTINLYYFWSANQAELSTYTQNRVQQLRSLSPNTNFVGIDISQNKEAWNRYINSNGMSSNPQYHSANFNDVSQKLLIYNMNKSVIIDKDGKIVSAFENIFSPNLERLLLN